MTEQALNDARPAALKITLLAASTLTVMAGITVAPALPLMHDQFRAVAGADLLTRLVLTVPSLFIAIAAPLAGVVVDRLGRRPILIAATVVYVVAGISGLFLESLTAILVGRALLGMAAGAIMTTAITLIGDYFSGEARERMMSLQAAAMALGGGIYLAVGGLFADYGWRAPFAIYFAPLALLPLMVSAVPEPTGETAGAEAEGAETPGVPLRGFVAFIVVLALINMIAYYMVPVQLPFLLRELGTETASLAGLALAVATLVGAVVSSQYARLKARLSHPAVFALGFAVMGLGFALVAAATGYAIVVVAMAVVGIGMGAALPNYSVWVVGRAPLAVRGRVIGGVITAFFLGQFLSPLVAQPIVDRFSIAGAYGVAAVALLVLAAGFIVAVVLQRRPSPEGPAP